MKNITLITSILETPNTKLSYAPVRSIYTKEERFVQTKYTILSVREKIPNNKIILVECSPLSEEETKYFIENTDHFLNLYYDTNREHIIPRVYSNSKSMGEGIMTIFALFYIFENNICFDNLFKISGRYWLNENFHYEDHEPNKSSIKYIDNNVNNCLTALYKLSYHTADKWHYYLMNSNDKFMTCTSYEEIFADFMKTIDDNEKKRIENKIGVSGYISVDGFYIDT